MDQVPLPLRRTVLALSSGGGHWVQLCRLVSALHGHDIVYATVNRDYAKQVPKQRFYVIPDATRWNKIQLAWLACRVLLLLLQVRPHVVVSTGAAPGYVAIRIAKMLGARTIWLDSIANADALSLSGQRVGPYADLWLTQWPHLADAQGPQYLGSVL